MAPKILKINLFSAKSDAVSGLVHFSRELHFLLAQMQELLILIG
jgi:hypothetical protein